MEKQSQRENSDPNVFAPAVCPACSHGNAVAVGSPAPGFPTLIADRSFVQPGYSIVECRNCGLLYKTATLSPEGLADYYSLVDYGKWESNELFPTEMPVAEILKKAPPGARILDFGCSTGRLLSRFVDVHETFGFEVNERAAREAAQKGIRMLSPDELNATPAKSFDFVVLVDVFEHLNQPTDLLKRMAELIRPGGRLVLVTGDGDARVCRIDPAQFWYFRLVEHVVMLTQRHLLWLGGELGLKLENSKRVSHYQRSFSEAIHQWARHFAYWTVQKRRPWASALSRVSSSFRKAEKWECAPQLDVTRDHVVAVFRKPGEREVLHPD